MAERSQTSEAVTAAPSPDPIRVAILGLAHVPHAMSYARCLEQSTATELVAFYEPDEQLARRVTDRFDTPHSADLASLLERPDLDAVVVCSATNEHRTLVERAAQHGLHIVCEKPIATSVADAEAMIETCATHGVQLHTAFVCRFYPFIAQIREAIDSGAIGRVVGMVGGNRGRPPLPPDYPEWITDPQRAGGGAVIDHSVHVTDIMRFLSGHEVARVSAEIDDRFWSCGVDDMGVLSLQFDGGAIATVDPSWSIPSNHPWDYDFFLQVLGTEGSLWVDDSVESLMLVSETAGPGLRRSSFATDIDALMIDAFATSVRTGRRIEPCADGVDGLRALEVAIAGYQASATNDSVELVRMP